MSRFNDDLWAVPLDAEWDPFTASQLLTHLGVFTASEDRQREAVAAWLRTHKPLPILTASLEAAGLSADSLSSTAVGHHSAA